MISSVGELSRATAVHVAPIADHFYLIMELTVYSSGRNDVVETRDSRAISAQLIVIVSNAFSNLWSVNDIRETLAGLCV